MHAVEAVDQTLRRLFDPVSFIARNWTVKATRATNPFLVSRILLAARVFSRAVIRHAALLQVCFGNRDCLTAGKFMGEVSE